MSRPVRTDWEAVPRDPDPHADLGYEHRNWTVLETGAGYPGYRLFLPPDEERLRTEAFVVADAASVCDLGRRR